MNAITHRPPPVPVKPAIILSHMLRLQIKILELSHDPWANIARKTAVDMLEYIENAQPVPPCE